MRLLSLILFLAILWTARYVLVSILAYVKAVLHTLVNGGHHA
jgi:hypothetical protein